MYSIDTRTTARVAVNTTCVKYPSVDHKPTVHVTPSPYVPEMVVVYKSGTVALWDAATSQVVQTYDGGGGGGGNSDGNNGNRRIARRNICLTEYMRHPRCVWSVRSGGQNVEMLDMRASAKATTTTLRRTVVGSGGKALEGFGGALQPITALHCVASFSSSSSSSSFHCAVGSHNRVVLFDTRYTRTPVRMWHNNHLGTVHALHSQSLGHGECGDEEDNEKDWLDGEVEKLL